MPVSQKELRSLPPTDRLITAEELSEHPEWGPCELIRGKVIPLSVPKMPHGFIAAIICMHVLAYVLKHRLGKVFSNDSGVMIEHDPDTVRGPDVGFISSARIPSMNELQGYSEIAPDLCVEVVSPTDRWSAITEKVDMFLGTGVTIVWVVDPNTRNAHVYRKGREPLIIEAAGVLDGEDVLPGFRLPLQEIFAVLDN